MSAEKVTGIFGRSGATTRAEIVNASEVAGTLLENFSVVLEQGLPSMAVFVTGVIAAREGAAQFNALANRGELLGLEPVPPVLPGVSQELLLDALAAIRTLKVFVQAAALPGPTPPAA